MKAKDIEVGKFYKVKVFGGEVIAIVESVKKGNYIYRYVLVDRFQHDGKNHYGFDKKQGKTIEEIFALKKDRQIRRKYIIRK